MGSITRGTRSEADSGDVAVVEPAPDPFAPWRSLQDADTAPDGATADLLIVDPDALQVLDDPALVLTDGYIGTERRRRGAGAGFARATWAGRRRLLRLDLLIVLTLVALVVGAMLLVASGQDRTVRPDVTAAAPLDGVQRVRPHTPSNTPPGPSATALAATAPAAAPAAAVPTPVATPAAAAAAPTPAATPPGATDADATASPDSPQAMGAAALALIRYPWQKLPGYSIEFLPIGDAPSPGFYGNTDFVWGQAGGKSTLYVYPGETVERLAGITAFEIGHEVDASAVEPQGGHDAIAGLLGMHPASWAPQCDCAEQGYLSGWYAAAFSSYWSPGVGSWSSLAPLPTGATLTAMEPWLDPRIP